MLIAVISKIIQSPLCNVYIYENTKPLSMNAVSRRVHHSLANKSNALFNLINEQNVKYFIKTPVYQLNGISVLLIISIRLPLPGLSISKSTRLLTALEHFVDSIKKSISAHFKGIVSPN